MGGGGREQDTRKKRNGKIEGARRLYAAVLTKALEYGGADVGVIVYKSTREWIQKNCFVPDWLKLLHWGDLTGTNALQRVRAMFVIGRPLASPEDVTRQAEALFGTYIPQREYVVRQKQGRIPIIPDAAGNNCILVDVREHPDPIGGASAAADHRGGASSRPPGGHGLGCGVGASRWTCTCGPTCRCPSWGRSSRCCGAS